MFGRSSSRSRAARPLRPAGLETLDARALLSVGFVGPLPEAEPPVIDAHAAPIIAPATDLQPHESAVAARVGDGPEGHAGPAVAAASDGSDASAVVGLKKCTDKELENIDAEEFKDSIVPGQGSLFNIYKDDQGYLWLVRIRDSSVKVETEYTLETAEEDFPKDGTTPVDLGVS